MKKPFSTELCELSDGLGIAIYQRMTLLEASLCLRCTIENLELLIKSHKIGYVTLPNEQIEFFGYMLLEYILNNVTKPKAQESPPQGQNQERILRLEEVTKLVGVSRSTLWRMERDGEFVARIPLSNRSVGWRKSEVDKWLKSQ